MRAILDRPVSMLGGGDVGRSGHVAGEAGDSVDDLLSGALAVQAAGVAHGAQDLGGVGEVDPFGRGDA